jgi:hypothetical protein
MFMHVQRMINEIVADEPDPAAANALQEGLGGQFGEMRTMMQYLFQAFNFRGATGKPYKALRGRHRGDRARRADRHHHRAAHRRFTPVQGFGHQAARRAR